MSGLGFPADVDRPSARWLTVRRRIGLVALVCVAAGLGLYGLWTRSRSRLLADLTAKFGNSTASEFRASDTSISCRRFILTDDLAQAIASRQKIGAINLADCQISSDGWTSITGLPNLTNFSALDCTLSGSETIRFGASQSWERMVIARTKLEGSNLADFLSAQSHLESLHLEETGITDADLKGWTPGAHLSYVTIRERRLTGAGMAALSRCRRLQSLTLAWTGIDDKGLAQLAGQPLLKSLDLTACRALDGSGLAQFASLPALTDLDLSGTQVTDKGLESLAGGFPAMRHVRMTQCSRLTDAVFQSLAKLPRLTTLTMSGTRVTGRGLKFLAGHSSLSTLVLSGTQLDDEGFATLGTMPALTNLDLSHTRISGGSLARLKGCPRLDSLSIAGCDVSRRAVASLRGAAPSLGRLDCSDCAAVDDETIEALRGMTHLRSIERRGTRVFDTWDFSVGQYVGASWNRVEKVLSHAEIDAAAALDLNASGRLNALSLDYCRLSASALKIATSSPALRILSLDGCTILGGEPGRLGALERLESLTIRSTAVDAADIVRVSRGRRLGGLAVEGGAINPGAFLAWTGTGPAKRFELKGVKVGVHNLIRPDNTVANWTLDLGDSDATDAMLQSLRGFAGFDTMNLAGCKQVTDRGLLSLSEMPRLQSLNLSGTGITDQGLLALSHFPGLQTLDLSRTRIDGHGLTHLKQQKFLVQLNLTATKLTDNGLAAVEFPASLSGLIVANTAIHGTRLAGLSKVRKLWLLNLSGSNVDDDGLQTIAAIPSLVGLDLSHCSQITDAGLRHLALSKLSSLDLQATHTSDAALAAIATMPKLRSLNLRTTPVTAQGARKLLSSPSLLTLQADEGSVPRSLVSQFNHSRVAPIGAK